MIHLLRNLAGILTGGLAASAAYAADVPTLTVGDVSISGPAIVGVAACLLVRIYLWSISKNKLLIYNASLTGIASLGTAVYVVDHDMGYSAAFFTGCAFGSGAVALIEFSRSQVFDRIKSGILSGLSSGAAASGDKP